MRSRWREGRPACCPAEHRACGSLRSARRTDAAAAPAQRRRGHGLSSAGIVADPKGRASRSQVGPDIASGGSRGFQSSCRKDPASSISRPIRMSTVGTSPRSARTARRKHSIVPSSLTDKTPPHKTSRIRINHPIFPATPERSFRPALDNFVPLAHQQQTVLDHDLQRTRHVSVTVRYHARRSRRCGRRIRDPPRRRSSGRRSAVHEDSSDPVLAQKAADEEVKISQNGLMPDVQQRASRSEPRR